MVYYQCTENVRIIYISCSERPHDTDVDVLGICSYAGMCCDVYLLLHTALFSGIGRYYVFISQEMEGVLSVLVVDEVALERCLHTFHSICESVDAANGTFGVPLAIYLIWVVLSIINPGLQLALKQEMDIIIHMSSFSCAIMIIMMILVPPSVMTAQVKSTSLSREMFCNLMIISDTGTIIPGSLQKYDSLLMLINCI